LSDTPVLLRIVDQPYVTELRYNDGAGVVTSDPNGSEVESADLDTVYEQAANSGIRIVELPTEVPPAPPEEEPTEGGTT
jgi:hypothetical protein